VDSRNQALCCSLNNELSGKSDVEQFPKLKSKYHSMTLWATTSGSLTLGRPDVDAAYTEKAVLVVTNPN